jgi:hypothetical protein
MGVSFNINVIGCKFYNNINVIVSKFCIINVIECKFYNINVKESKFYNNINVIGCKL